MYGFGVGLNLMYAIYARDTKLWYFTMGMSTLSLTLLASSLLRPDQVQIQHRLGLPTLLIYLVRNRQLLISSPRRCSSPS